MYIHTSLSISHLSSPNLLINPSIPNLRSRFPISNPTVFRLLVSRSIGHDDPCLVTVVVIDTSSRGASHSSSGGGALNSPRGGRVIVVPIAADGSCVGCRRGAGGCTTHVGYGSWIGSLVVVGCLLLLLWPLLLHLFISIDIGRDTVILRMLVVVDLLLLLIGRTSTASTARRGYSPIVVLLIIVHDEILQDTIIRDQDGRRYTESGMYRRREEARGLHTSQRKRRHQFCMREAGSFDIH